jgi:hypothetical protein
VLPALAQFALTSTAKKERYITLPSGVLRRDDWLRQPRLPHRVVPLWLHEPGRKAQGQVVLPQVLAALQEEKMNRTRWFCELLFLERVNLNIESILSRLTVQI